MSNPTPSEKVAAYLIQKGLASSEVEDALRVAKRKGAPFAEVAQEFRLGSARQIAEWCAEAMGWRFVDLDALEPGPSLSRFLSETFARKNLAVIVPSKDGRFCLARAECFDEEVADQAKSHSGIEFDEILGDPAAVRRAIEKIYAKDGAENTDPSGTDFDSAKSEGGFGELSFGEEDGEAPIVKVVDLILMDACDKGASDIHVEPFENRVRVRYRVDGHLQEALTIPRRSLESILARFKILANLNITENRVPQDGRFKMRIGSKEIDYRISILPCFWGGKVVLRSLDRSNLKFNLEELGFSEKSLIDFKTASEKPHGMIVVTGPTGSGKSTTLYSLISRMNAAERNIITVEDPIEYQISGITQVQARPDIGMSFAGALRSILRQSPDIVMVGEIRDSETADMAVKASLTGQIVLTTLHTNDAAGAIVRLRDMGIESFLIASSLSLVAAQRLCRRICEHCKVRVQLSKDELLSLGFDTTVAALVDEPKFSMGKGCARCGRTGYKGRISITETLLLDGALRAMIEKGTPSDEIKRHAMRNGMLTLRTDALLKFSRGIISMDEVVRTTAPDL